MDKIPKINDDENMSDSSFKEIKFSLFKAIYNYQIYNPPIAKGTLSTIYVASKEVNKIDLIAKVLPNIITEKKKIYIQNMIEVEKRISNNNMLCHHIDIKYTQKSLYMIYPLMRGGTLEKYLRKRGGIIPENEAIQIIYQIAKAIEVLHNLNIIHRDINPLHIFSSSEKYSKFYLGGFLCSRILNPQEKCNEVAGTEGYLAPEIERNSSKNEYGLAADIFSLGATFYRMIYGENFSFHYFDNLNKNELNSGLDNKTINLLLHCLNKDPNQRYSIKEFLLDEIFQTKISNKTCINQDSPNLKLNLKEVKIEIPERTSKDPYIKEKTILLGEGGFGKVFRCYKKDNPSLKFAMKIVRTNEFKSEKILNQLRREIDLMVQLKGLPFVINLYEFFYYKKKLHLILEFCNGGNLEDYIEKLSNKEKCLDFDELKIIAWNLASALKKMHSLNIIHRDIKPNNILLIKNNRGALIDSKLCDFGLSKQFANHSNSILGTPSYFAPEIYAIMRNEAQSYTNKIDVWSYGCLLFYIAYQMEVGDFPSNSRENIYQLGQISHPKNSRIMSDYVDLINHCLQIEPNKRPSFDDIFLHEFFKIIRFDILTKFPYNISYPIKKDKLDIEYYFESTNQFCIKQLPKEINSNPEGQKHFIREIDTLQKMKGCPNIIKLEKCFLFEGNLFVAFEYCNGGNLWKFLQHSKWKSYPIEAIQKIGKEVAESLSFLHSRGVIHRNINPHNIFLKITQGEIISSCVGDFGYSRVFDPLLIELSMIKKSSVFSSPEILSGQIYREEADIFSYGMVLYFMFYGMTAEIFQIKLPEISKEKNNYKKILFPSTPQIPEFLADLIQRCFLSPKLRIKAYEILKHSFFENTPIKVKLPLNFNFNKSNM